MCYGIRISSPFHLNTLNIPIQNIKCPKNTKNACTDIIFSPAIICEAWTVFLHNHAKPNLCDWQCYPWITLFGAMLCAGICDQGWKWLQSFVISSSKHEMCFHVFHPSSLTWQHCYVRACVFGVFKALNILNGYVLRALLERAQNSDSETHVKRYNRNSGTDLSH